MIYTDIDAFGHEYESDNTPDAVWMEGEQNGAWVPWSIRQHYGPDATLDEIVADIASDQEEDN